MAKATVEVDVSPLPADSPKPSPSPPHPDAKLIDLITSQSDAFFKSQQRDEADLTTDQKRVIVTGLLQTNRSLFLARYGKYLDEVHLARIESLAHEDDSSNQADIKVQLANLREKNRLKQCTVKNRRYNAMQKMLDQQDSYFSDSEMQSRDPYLFEQLIGQYMDDRERKELQESSYRLNYNNANFSSFLMEQIRTIHLNCRYMVDEHVNEQEEEEDEDEDESDAEPEDKEKPPKQRISPESKQQKQDEFRVQMMENFLAGKDRDFFDYSTVDDNEDYDMSEQLERDAEDRYFEED